MRFAAVSILAMLAACQDYEPDPGKDDSGADDSATVATANASINLILQYTDFGNRAQSCYFGVAFYRVSEDDGYADGGTAQTITMPTEPGTCAFTLFDPDDTGMGGSMTVLGTLDAGPELHAYNDAYNIELVREESEDGSLRYRWDACGRDGFPFAQTLSLRGAGVEGGIASFDLLDVIAVGPDLIQGFPRFSDVEDGVLPHSLSQPLDWEWSWSAPFPSTSEGPVAMSEMFVIRNARSADNQILESLACMPSEAGALTVAPADLAQLTPDPGDHSIYANGQLDAFFYGAPSLAPWGQTLRAQSLISVSGVLRLSP